MHIAGPDGARNADAMIAHNKDRTGKLAAYYATRAQEYERSYGKPERQDDLARLRRLIPGHFTDRKVLEIACGTGYLLPGLQSTW